ncbi:MAG TPA: cytochrome D1 domain-containing protein [Pyrinomonadaceae bacterium]|nr:cytochrome D1 domain-containing protein [Pyrinomonadaceae bacterium]
MLLRFFAVVLLLLTTPFARVWAQETKHPKRQTFTAEGISIEFSVEPVRSSVTVPIAGEEATVRFKISGTNGGVPLSNLRPVAWIDQRATQQPSGARECREKVQSFLQSSFTKRPTLDLNAYFILALNNEPNISVIDPLSGFGGSKLYTLVALKSPGEDWVLSSDNKRIYVSMPLVNQIAVVDVPSWKVIANVDAGSKPTRVRLQHDGRYLWIGNDGATPETSGVTVLDTVSNKVVARLKTGAGHHEIVFNDDDSLAFVTNKDAGTLSVVDIRTLAVSKEVKVGAQPVSIAYSSLGKTVYVANEGDGTISAIGGAKHEVLARILGEPGLRSVRIAPDGRYGFALNTAKNEVYVFDLSSNRVIHRIPTGQAADQITFSNQFAYIRSAGSEFVSMIRLLDLGKEAAVTKFPAGQKAPAESRATSIADAIVPAPDDGSVLVANPADKMIYYYTEGMAAPMGSFQNYKRDPRALLVLDNSLRERQTGVYTSTVRLTNAGYYDVAFLLDSPRVVNCFDLTIAENPALPRKVETAIRIDPVVKEALARVGERFNIRFRLLDTNTGAPKLNLDDVRVLVFLAPGIWQQRDEAKSVGDGVYETSFVPPNPGVYYVFVQSASLGLDFNQSTPLTVQAGK